MFTKRLLVAALLIVSTKVSAQTAEYLTTESTAAESVAELETSLGSLDDEEEVLRAGFWRLRNRGPFLEDSRINFNFRGYEFDRTDGLDEPVSRASTLGGELGFESGQWKDVLSVAASWYLSEGIDAPADLDGTGLLAPGQSDISVLGRAFVQLDTGRLTTRLYRQDFSLPYINRQDSRMVPTTHEAYGITGDGDRIAFAAGHVTKVKLRNSEKFITMAEAAGIVGGNSGTTYGGLRFRPSDGFEIGGMFAYTRNAFNITYAESTWARALSDHLAVKVSGQYTDQRSVGTDAIGDFATHTWGLRVGTSFRNTSVTLAYTNTDDGGNIRSPFGGKPSFNSMMLLDFDRAGEEARRLAVTYHFGRLGFPGVSVQFNVAEGRNAINPVTGVPLDPANETDVTIDYRPQQGRLQGLWIRFRMADANISDPTIDRSDTRIIINYDFLML